MYTFPVESHAALDAASIQTDYRKTHCRTNETTSLFSSQFCSIHPFAFHPFIEPMKTGAFGNGDSAGSGKIEE